MKLVDDFTHSPGAISGHAVEAIAAGVKRTARDRELATDGWTRRFVGAPPKLQELAELYESLEFEVLLDPIHEDELAEACAGCALALTFFRVIYTRSER